MKAGDTVRNHCDKLESRQKPGVSDFRGLMMREICDKMKTKNCLLNWRSSWLSCLMVVWMFLSHKVSVLVPIIQTLEINEFMQKIILKGSGLVWLVFC